MSQFRKPMKILLTADIHYDRVWYEWLVAQSPEYDLVAIAGDLVQGFDAAVAKVQQRDIEGWLARIAGNGCAVAVSSGNHEMFSKTSLRVGSGDGFSLANALRSLLPAAPTADRHPLFLEDGTTGVIESGSGGLIVSTIPYKKFGEPLTLSARSPMWEEGRALRNQTGFAWLVLHHDPPGGGPVGGMAGDFELRRTVERFQPDFVLSGHLHGQPFFPGGGFHQQIGASHCFNAGQTPPTKSQVPNHIVLDTDTRLAVWNYLHLATGVFKKESRLVASPYCPARERENPT